MKPQLRRIKARIRRPLLHPGQVFYSPGRTFKYRVVGACCRLYDREQLPYPCCSLDWRGKQPSWRRIGRRFVLDVAAQRSPSYCVQLLDYPNCEPFVITMYWLKLSPQKQQWWYSKWRMERAAQSTLEQPIEARADGDLWLKLCINSIGYCWHEFLAPSVNISQGEGERL